MAHQVSRRAFLRTLAGASAVGVSAAMLAACGGTAEAPTAATSAPASASTDSSGEIKVGILHSLSGTMSISEVAVKDAEMMAIDEINAAGGLLGKKIVPVIEDGASDWPTFAEKARKLLTVDKVTAIFGCWTSASRKQVLPVVEELNGLLWYPVQYEGLEQSPNIFYTGATTNQQIVPAVDYLMKEAKKSKFYLLGSDYVFPRTSNKIITAQLKAAGLTPVGEEYTPLGHTEYSTVISKIQQSGADVVFNTLNGDSNVAFFKQLKDAGLTVDKLLTLSVSVAEEEIRGIGPENMEGHLTAWNYFQTTDTPENKKFVEAYKAKYGADRVTDDPIEAGYFGVYLWSEAVKKANSTAVADVKKAADGISFNAPEGPIKIDGATQHTYKTVRIGKARADGMFDEVWNSGEPVKPDPYLKSYAWAGELASS